MGASEVCQLPSSPPWNSLSSLFWARYLYIYIFFFFVGERERERERSAGQLMPTSTIAKPFYFLSISFFARRTRKYSLGVGPAGPVLTSWEDLLYIYICVCVCVTDFLRLIFGSSTRTAGTIWHAVTSNNPGRGGKRGGFFWLVVFRLEHKELEKKKKKFRIIASANLQTFGIRES